MQTLTHTQQMLWEKTLMPYTRTNADTITHCVQSARPISTAGPAFGSRMESQYSGGNSSVSATWFCRFTQALRVCQNHTGTSSEHDTCLNTPSTLLLTTHALGKKYGSLLLVQLCKGLLKILACFTSIILKASLIQYIYSFLKFINKNASVLNFRYVVRIIVKHLIF